MMDFGGNYLNNDDLEVCCWDEPFDDNFNEPIHESWLHMQGANKTKASSLVSTVKWSFSPVETMNITTPLLFSTSWAL